MLAFLPLYTSTGRYGQPNPNPHAVWGRNATKCHSKHDQTKNHANTWKRHWRWGHDGGHDVRKELLKISLQLACGQIRWLHDQVFVAFGTPCVPEHVSLTHKFHHRCWKNVGKAHSARVASARITDCSQSSEPHGEDKASANALHDLYHRARSPDACWDTAGSWLYKQQNNIIYTNAL